MESLGSVIDRYKQKPKDSKKPLHEKAASVDEILNVVGQNKTYGYTYWLAKVGSATFSAVLAICKAALEMPVQMRGGYITNQLKKYIVKKPKRVIKKHEPTDTK